MSDALGAYCDEFHVATRLFLKLDLTLERETVLHFFDSLKREFPLLCKLRRREDESLLLEEDETPDGSRRWLRLDVDALRTGYDNPAHTGAAAALGQTVLRLAPYHLTLSDLDYSHLEVVYGFDLEYRGNHDQLVAETLLGESPLSGLLIHDTVRHVIDAQPLLGVAVSDSCDTQVYVDIKSHTSTYEVRTQRYEGSMLSVLLTVRRYWGMTSTEGLVEVHRTLTNLAEEWAADRVVPLVVHPLAQAISSGR